MRSSAKNLGVVDLVSKNHSKETGVGGRKKRTLKIPKFCLFSYDMISYIISYDEIMQVNRKKIRRLFFRPKKFTTKERKVMPCFIRDIYCHYYRKIIVFHLNIFANFSCF